MRKTDIILCLLLATLAAAGFFYTQNKSPGQTITVSTGWRIIWQQPLDKLPQTINIPTECGVITISKTAGGVKVRSAPCPDKLCQKQGVITNSGSSIICVPCRTVITLTDTGHEYDAILN